MQSSGRIFPFLLYTHSACLAPALRLGLLLAPQPSHTVLNSVLADGGSSPRTVCALEGRLGLEHAVGPLSALVTEGKGRVVMCPGVLRVEEYLRNQEMFLASATGTREACEELDVPCT